jgi:putative CocE/NonD family hydrolase
MNRILPLLTAFFAMSWLGAQTPAPSAQGKASPPPTDFAIRWAVKIPLRDGVQLNATLYLPKTIGTAKVPAVFTLTPYISDTYHERGAYFAAHGYAFALVDVRGRGNSGGEFEPFAHEPEDGHDVVEWLAQQDFCNGKVAMWGGSYAGFDQWATAKEFPPHLSTIVPAAAAHPPLDYPSTNNVGQTYDVRWFTLTSAHTGQQNLFADDKFWNARFLDAYRQHVRFRDLDSFVGNPSPNFRRILDHPMADTYYDAMTPSAEQYKKIALPVLTITGQYDGDELGAMAYYRDHLANAPADARAKHYLVIGPWDHAGTRTPTDEVDGVKLGAGALLDLNELHRQWYDWTMKSGARPEFLKKLVAYYVLAPGNSGANGEWRYADSLAAASMPARKFYLDAHGDGHGVLHSGSLGETPPKSGADEYVYDPLDLHRGEMTEGPDRNEKISLLDQSYALNIGGDGLVYHTEPFAAETEFIGCPQLTLWVSIDTPDTDLSADLYEIQPDGISIYLWGDLRRLRYRESLRAAKLVAPGEIVRCDFAPGTFVGRRLLKGSRLRLIVSSPNSIATQKNYNSGGVVADETAGDARTAHVKIFHDSDHASLMQLPVR